MRDTSNMDTLLACIQRTLMEVRVFLVESQIVNLQRDLEKAKGAEIEQQRMIVVQILDLLIKKQEIETRFIRNLKTSGVDFRNFRDPVLRQVLIENQDLTPYPLFLCPIDPAHYRKRLKPGNKITKCPLHLVELVVED